MEIESPLKTGFTIYSKSGCPNCIVVKKILQENKLVYSVINCDEYIIEDKKLFLKFISQLAEKECNVFPIVFFDGKFVGGFKETKEYVDKIMIFEENSDF